MAKRDEILKYLMDGSGAAKSPAVPNTQEPQTAQTPAAQTQQPKPQTRRDEIIQFLLTPTEGSSKPKNNTVDNSSFTAQVNPAQRASLQKELDRLNEASAYVTTTEQSDEIERQRKPIIEKLRQIDAAEGKSGVYTGKDRLKNEAQNVHLAVQQGLTEADHRIAQTADWLFGGIAKEGRALLNATLQSINPDWGFENEDPLITQYNKKGAAVLAQNDAIAQKRIEEGKMNATAWKYAPEVVAALPDAMLAMMTAGASTGAQATRAGVETASAIAQSSRAAQKVIPIANAAKDMMKSPAWQSSFVQSAGSSYEAALADGATEDEANLYALINGYANATIEVGGSDEGLGGIQKLPQKVRTAIEKGDKSVVMQWVKSTLSEAKEEVVQGATEKALRGIYADDAPLYSKTDENAVINPSRAKEEALGGLIVGGVLGGGQTALQSAINSGRGQNVNGAQGAQETQNAAGDISAPPTQANADTGVSARLNSDVQAGANVQSAENIKNPAPNGAEITKAAQTADANAWRGTSETKNTAAPAAEAEASDTNIAQAEPTVNLRSEPAQTSAEVYGEGQSRAGAAASGGEKVRGFSRNIATDEAMNEDLRESHRENPDTYDPLANKTVLAKAEAIYARGFDSAYATLQRAIGAAQDGGKKLSPEMLPLGRMVANELAKTDLNAAREITTDLAIELTEAGQFIQAVKLLRQTGMSPLDVILTMEKGLAKINKAVEKKSPRQAAKWKAELTQSEIEQIQNTDFTQDGAFESTYEQIMKRVGEEMPADLMEKVTELRRIGMLLNPRTQIKNVAANAPMVLMRKTAEKLSGAIQDQLVKHGKLDKAEQTRTAKVSKESRTLAKEVYKDVASDLKGQTNKWDMRQDINKYRSFFKKGRLQKAIESASGKEMQTSLMEATRRLTYDLLERGDAPFVKSAFVDSLAQYCEAQGITDSKGVTQEAIDFATANAFEATFKNANAIADAINSLKRSDSAAAAALDIILPFTTTPANIMSLMLKYSPAGFAAEIVSKYKGTSTKAERIDMISKASVGTAVMALGFGLRALGAISGAEPDDDDEAAWMKANGWQAYSFHGRDGNWYYSYDWAQPVGSLLTLGAEIYDAAKGQEDWGDALWNALYAAGDATLNMSMFENVLGILKGTGSPTEKVLEEIITGGASQLMPGIAGAIARTIDDTYRSTYTGGNVAKDTVAQLLAKTPWASKKLPASVNVKGEESKRGSAAERFLQQFISPGNLSIGKGKKNEVDREIETLHKETGSNSVFPRRSPYKVSYDGENYTFTGEDRAEFQKVQGKQYYENAAKLLASDVYAKASSEDKAEMLAELSSYSLDAAKREYFDGKDGVDYSSDKYDSIHASNLERVWEYLGVKTAYSQAAKRDDYKAIDGIMKVFSELAPTTKSALANSSATARLDDMAEAYTRGKISAERWNTAYDEYKRLNAVKRSGYTASDKATDFEAWMERAGFDANQRRILDDQFTFYNMNSGSAERYASLRSAGFDTSSAQMIYTKISDLKAPAGRTTVQTWQKLEAINELDMSAEDKVKALSVYFPADGDGEEDATVRRYKAAMEQGISFSTWTKITKIIADTGSTKRAAIFSAIKAAGYTETDAQIIYDIWKHS